MPTHQQVYYIPHPDDETLSMGLHIIHQIAAGNPVHLVFMSRGANTGALNVLRGTNGVSPVSCGFHGWTHNPVREGYADELDGIDIAQSRIHEGRSAFGLMGTMPAMGGVTPGTLTWSESGLADGFGGVLPPTQAAVDAVKGVIQDHMAMFPSAFHYTMSASDQQPDHAACGKALRQLKDTEPSLANAKFFVSRLYWASSNGGDYPDYVEAEALNGPIGSDGKPTSTLQWYDSVDVGNRYAELCGFLRTRVVPVYGAWNPAEGCLGIGRHSVNGQFNSNFAAGVTIANLMHL